MLGVLEQAEKMGVWDDDVDILAGVCVCVCVCVCLCVCVCVRARAHACVHACVVLMFSIATSLRGKKRRARRSPTAPLLFFCVVIAGLIRM